MTVIPAGALYQGRDLINSYNLVTLDIEQNAAQVVFRRYSDMQQEWLKDLDATGEIKDGKLRFDLQIAPGD